MSIPFLFVFLTEYQRQNYSQTLKIHWVNLRIFFSIVQIINFLKKIPLKHPVLSGKLLAPGFWTTTNLLRGLLFLLQPSVLAGDLAQRVKDAKKSAVTIAEDIILHWFVQVIFAVQYLHRNNILHRGNGGTFKSRSTHRMLCNFKFGLAVVSAWFCNLHDFE